MPYEFRDAPSSRLPFLSLLRPQWWFRRAEGRSRRCSVVPYRHRASGDERIEVARCESSVVRQEIGDAESDPPKLRTQPLLSVPISHCLLPKDPTYLVRFRSPECAAPPHRPLTFRTISDGTRTVADLQPHLP